LRRQRFRDQRGKGRRPGTDLLIVLLLRRLHHGIDRIPVVKVLVHQLIRTSNPDTTTTTRGLTRSIPVCMPTERGPYLKLVAIGVLCNFLGMPRLVLLEHGIDVGFRGVHITLLVCIVLWRHRHLTRRHNPLSRLIHDRVEAHFPPTHGRPFRRGCARGRLLDKRHDSSVGIQNLGVYDSRLVLLLSFCAHMKHACQILARVPLQRCGRWHQTGWKPP
jgi:hypothetical protein